MLSCFVDIAYRVTSLGLGICLRFSDGLATVLRTVHSIVKVRYTVANTVALTSCHTTLSTV